MKNLLCAVVSAAVMFPSIVYACSIQLPPPTQAISPVIEGDTILFYFSDLGDQVPAATLSKDGTEIEGTVRALGSGEFLFVASEALSGEYQFQVRPEEGNPVVETVTTDVEGTFTFSLSSFDTERRIGGESCCDAPSDEGCSDNYCWTTQYVYRPTLNIQIDPKAHLRFETVVSQGDFETDHGETIGVSLEQVFVNQDIGTDPICVKVVAEDLDGNLVEEQTECIEVAEFPSPKRESPPEPDLSICEGGAEVVREPDPSLPNPIIEAETEGSGCSTASGNNGIIVFGMLFLFGLRRRSNRTWSTRPF